MASGYMPQRVFDIGASAVALIRTVQGTEPTEIAARLAEGYRGTYVDDNYWADWVVSAGNLLRMAEPAYSKEALPGLFRHFQFFRQNYDLSGKRRFRLFKGAIFNKEKAPNPRRVDDCTKAYLTFSVLADLEKIPLPPNGWKL